MNTQATGITASKKSEAIRLLAHATSSDCFAVRARKLAAKTIGENVNNQSCAKPWILVNKLKEKENEAITNEKTNLSTLIEQTPSEVPLTILTY